MALFNKIILMLSVVTFIALWEAPQAISARNLAEEDLTYPWKTHVIVYNLLEDFNLTIHCKSKDDDLGVHEILPEFHYEWTFRVNIWQTTLFFCRLSWPNGNGVYDLYDAKRDADSCSGSCSWHVSKDRIIGYDRYHTPDVEYNWSSSSSSTPSL